MIVNPVKEWEYGRLMEVLDMPKYKCVIHIRYPTWVTAPNMYDAQEKAMSNLGYDLVKDGLFNHMYIWCEEEEE